MRKGDEKRQAILDVSEKLFYLKGFEQTSVQDVLDVLKSSKGSFYHHFESKYSVLETLCAQRAEKAMDAAQESLHDDLDCLERLNKLLYYAMPLRKGEEQFLTLLLPMTATENGHTLCAQYAQALQDAFCPLLKEELHAAFMQKLVHLYYPDQTAPILMALLNQCWLKIAKHLMEVRQQGEAADAGQIVEILQAYRFSLERLIDAPFGTFEIQRITELHQVAQRVLVEIRLAQ